MKTIEEKMKTIQEKIAVMQAFADGKVVESRANDEDEWGVVTGPIWDWRTRDYRVKDEKPRTWEKFCDLYPIEDPKENIDGLLALIKLKRLRDAWVGDWQPNWTDDTRKFFICERPHDVLATAEFGFDTERRNLLSFPTRDMAEDFLACFEDLIKKAEMWL